MGGLSNSKTDAAVSLAEVPAQTPPADAAATSCPLFVDLDGTLIASDLLWEGLVMLLRQRPWLLLHTFCWMRGGRAHFKDRVAAHITPDPERLPYRDEVIAYLRRQRRRGRWVVLATAAHHAWAHVIANHLGVFDDLLATTPDENLKGPAKATAIANYCARRGETGFAYVGDSRADLSIWPVAKESLLVAPSPRLLKASEAFTNRHVFPSTVRRTASLLRSLETWRWLANLLLFLPLLLTWETADRQTWLVMGMAYAAFCAASSAAAVAAGMLRATTDRLDRRRKSLPFASGALPLSWGPPLSLALATCSAAAAIWIVVPAFFPLVGLYLLLAVLASAQQSCRPFAALGRICVFAALRLLAGATILAGTLTAIPSV